MATDVGVAVSVAVDCGTEVSVGDSDMAVSVSEGGITVLVSGWQATSKTTINAKNLLNPLSSDTTINNETYLKPSNRSVSTFLPPFTRLNAR